jgi:hypothetical protein
VAGSYEHGNEPSGSIKCGELFIRVVNLRTMRLGRTCFTLSVDEKYIKILVGKRVRVILRCIIRE